MTPGYAEVLGVRQVKESQVLGHSLNDPLSIIYKRCGHPTLAVATIDRAAAQHTAEVFGVGKLVLEVEQRRQGRGRTVIGAVRLLTDAVDPEGADAVEKPRGVATHHMEVTERFVECLSGRHRPRAA